MPVVVDTADGRLYGYFTGAWTNLTPSVGSISINTTSIVSGTSGYILYCNGTTVGAEQFVPAAHGGTGLDASAASNGQILIGNGSGLSLATITQGSGLTITNGAGTITVALTAPTSTQGISTTVSGGSLTVATTALNSDVDGATITFDMSVSDKHTVTLGGNRTLATTNDTTGKMFLVNLVQDGTGSRTVTWWSGIKWPGGSAPTLTTAANKTDTFVFIKTGAGAYLGYVAGQNL